MYTADYLENCLKADIITSNTACIEMNGGTLPFLCVEEEGGSQTPVSGNLLVADAPFKSCSELYTEGGIPALETDAAAKSEFLLSLGFNLNFWMWFLM